MLWKSIYLINSNLWFQSNIKLHKKGRLKGAFEQLQLLPNKTYIKSSFSCKTSKDLLVKLTANYYTFFSTIWCFLSSHLILKETIWGKNRITELSNSLRRPQNFNKKLGNIKIQPTWTLHKKIASFFLLRKVDIFREDCNFF